MAKKSETDAGPETAQIDRPREGRIRVFAAAKEGRRRAGLDFAQSGTLVDLAEISDEQFAAILSDPQLSVQPVKAEATTVG